MHGESNSAQTARRARSPFRSSKSLSVEPGRPSLSPVCEAQPLEPRLLLSASLVKDINAVDSPSGPSSFIQVGNAVYFSALDSTGQHGLWKTDGTAAGTVLVKEGVNATSIVNANGTLFFAGTDSNQVTRLWESDGTASGTAVVSTAVANPAHLTAAGGLVYFSIGTAIWRSDGTAAGTAFVSQVTAPSNGFPGVTSIAAMNGVIYVADVVGGTQGAVLWRSDGTAAGTRQLFNTGRFGSDLLSLTPVNGQLFFSAAASHFVDELWVYDGASPAPVLVQGATPMHGGLAIAPANLTNLNGTLYFTTRDGSLWRSDGTNAGTMPIRQMNQLQNTPLPTDLVAANGVLYFAAYSLGIGDELWTSDGTPNGTFMVKDINPGPGYSTPAGITPLGNKVVFTADDGVHGRQLWVSDGTAAGTMLLDIINPGQTSSPIQSLFGANGAVYFSADDGVHGTELWKTDGTPAGTGLLKDINTNTANSSIQQSLTIGGTMYLTADDGIHGAELWKTDGTAAGTMLVKDIYPGPTSSDLDNLTDVNGKLFFTADDGVHGTELWKSDGTAAGTVMVDDINPGPAASAPTGLTNVNGTLFFAADDGTDGVELWTSDGSASGTVLVKDINPGSLPSNPTNLTTFGGILLFDAAGDANLPALWRSNGTTAGTYPLTTSSTSYQPGPVTVSNGAAYFAFGDAAHGVELWKTDGTVAGTALFDDINPGTSPSNVSSLTDVNGTLFFTADDGVHGTELWKSDGTLAGTALVNDIFTGTGSSVPDDLTAANGAIYFYATDGTRYGLWKSDGTAAGTVWLTPMFPNAFRYDFYPIANVGGTAYFLTTRGASSVQLWKTDGTAAGTVIADPSEPTAAWQPNMILGPVNNSLLFTATDQAHGNEPWSLALPNATFGRSDNSTSGTWTGHYGQDGYYLFGGPANLPAYAQVSTSGASEWTWDASTTDVRAPQTAPGVTTRLAAADYSETSFTVDLNLTDGNPHQVAFYLLDFDYLGRAETVQVADGDSGRVFDTRTVGQFQGGEYLVYTLTGHVKITFTNAGGRNAVLSAILFDPASTGPSASAAFVGTDTIDQGQWSGRFASQGYDVIGAGSSLPAYASLSANGAQFWQWDAAGNLPQELQTSPGSTSRIAAADYSNAPSFSLDLNLTDGQAHRVALYLLDYDGRNRSETITISDAATGTVLDSELASNFTGGKYLIWNLSGHVTITITNAGGLNEVVSGLFIDPVRPVVPATAAFVATDAATQGTWTGVYGADGYRIANTGSSLPAYAALTAPAGLPNYTWASNTSDPRALQTGPGAATRIAATDYSDNRSVTLDLNLADGNVHRVALYFLDYDFRNRSEIVTITDPSNGAVLDAQSVSDFAQGKYFVWNLSGHVQITISNAGGLNEVLSGIFFG